MKKLALKKSLQLNQETVRALVSSDLRDVAGGARNQTRSACATDCIAISGYACQ